MPRCAQGTATRSNSSRNGADPSRSRACAIAPVSDLPVFLPCSGKQQARDEKAHHLLIYIAEEQAQGQHVIDHDPRRQQPGPLLYPPGFGKHIIDQVTIDKARQNPDANPVSQTCT